MIQNLGLEEQKVRSRLRGNYNETSGRGYEDTVAYEQLRLDNLLLELFDKKSVTGCEAGEVVTSMCDYYSIYAHHEFAMIDKRIQYSRKRSLQSSSQNIYTVRFGL